MAIVEYSYCGLHGKYYYLSNDDVNHVYYPVCHWCKEIQDKGLVVTIDKITLTITWDHQRDCIIAKHNGNDVGTITSTQINSQPYNSDNRHRYDAFLHNCARVAMREEDN